VTDRQILLHLGKALVAALAVTLLVVTGIAYGEITYHGPARVVETGPAR
jgi:hypothetical protein